MILRIIGIARGEITKMLRHRMFYVLILLALLLPFSFPMLHSFGTGLQVLEDSNLEGQPEVSGQEAFCSMVSWALIVIVPLLLIYSSMSMTSETENRTLKTMLVRPVRRTDLLAGKLLVLWLFTALLLAVLIFSSLSVSSMFFDWYDRFSLEEANPESIADKTRILHFHLTWMFPAVFFALLAFVTAAFSISTFTRGSGTSVGLTMVIFILGALFLVFSPPEGLDGIRPLVLNSYLGNPIDWARSAARNELCVADHEVYNFYFFAIVVPTAYILLTGTLSIVVFSRRRIATS